MVIAVIAATGDETMYALSTRTVTKPVRLGLGGHVTKTFQTITYKGEFYADVPDGEDAQALLDQLNEQERAAIAYRAQFTDSEWARQEDEAAGG